MSRKNRIDQWTEPTIGLDIPRLPFLMDADGPPSCRDHFDTFARAGDVDRLAVSTPAARRAHHHDERAARAVCAECPVLAGCRRYALRTRQRWGIWGGTTAQERETWTRLNPKRKQQTMAGNDETTPTTPLFDVTNMRVAADKPASVKSVGQGNCPHCLKGKVGVIPTGEHWVWRFHYFKTWGGDTRLCATSGVSLCVAPEPAGRELAVGKPITCPHGPDPAPRDAA